ncbi:hypothetical protein [[Acholeplasma] multilocale]|uniref:hypothetical protein n=1 Tax=[Acholeplasma] multilocale TaxID=264638 RepID=UPI000479793A|nr:hypothetical protein [[Acholeplasma] multilocale]
MSKIKSMINDFNNDEFKISNLNVKRTTSLLMGFMFKRVKTYIINFIFPSLISVIVFLFWSNFTEAKLYPPMFLSIISLPIFINMIFIGGTFLEMKNTILLQRIKTSKISKAQFLFSLMTTFVLIMMMSVVINLLIFVIYAYGELGIRYLSLRNPEMMTSTIIDLLTNLEWFVYFNSLLGLLFLSIMACSIVFIICNAVKHKIFSRVILISIVIAFILLSDVVINTQITSQSDAFRYVTYLIPTKYPIWFNMFISSYTYLDPKGISQLIDINKGTMPFSNIWIPLAGTIAWTALLLFIFNLTFKWNGKD